jgi:hypothetical protein
MFLKNAETSFLFQLLPRKKIYRIKILLVHDGCVVSSSGPGQSEKETFLKG